MVQKHFDFCFCLQVSILLIAAQHPDGMIKPHSVNGLYTHTQCLRYLLYTAFFILFKQATSRLEAYALNLIP